jgi:5-(carboxyamino)imidazole ribonucleotide synthase
VTAATAHTAGRMHSRASATVGMVGGGQLARMTYQAALTLGVDLRILAAESDDAVAEPGLAPQAGSPTDLETLRSLARSCDVLTFDHELVPTKHLEVLQREGCVLRPGPKALRVAQDKLHARVLMSRAGFPVPEFKAALSVGELVERADAWGWPIVVKERLGGYDGGGIAIVERDELLGFAAGPGWFAEQQVEIERELSQLIARSPSGEVVAYPLTESVQVDGICVETSTPAPVSPELTAKCRELALSLAETIDAVGVMALELFLTRDGALLVNEIALRPHNTGHYTIEACETSQFENHLRAVLDWPLGSTAMKAPAAVMANVLGSGDANPADALQAALRVPGAHPHLYGKQPRNHRKLGHVTALGPSLEQARETSRRSADILTGGSR